jgi:hypothetical protein
MLSSALAPIATPVCRGQEPIVRYAVRPFPRIACIKVPTRRDAGRAAACEGEPTDTPYR